MLKIIFTLNFLILSFSLIASEHSEVHHIPSVSDLFWPTVNFIILFTFLFLKLKKPLNEMFVKKAKNIEELYFSANKKDKESQERLDKINQQFKELSFLREDVMKKAESDLNKFKETCTNDIKEHHQKQKNDLASKIKNENQKAEVYLREKLFSKVLDDVTGKVKSDNGLKDKITNKLLKKLS